MAKKKKTTVAPKSYFFDDNQTFEVVIYKQMWCDDEERRKPILVCLYRCPNKAKCKAYAENYDDIVDMPIDQKYIDKYGIPEYPKPASLIRREKQAAKAERDAKKAAKKGVTIYETEPGSATTKRTRKTKAVKKTTTKKTTRKTKGI